MLFKADFHNHSCLSPCASLEMSPKILVETAAANGIKILALTDHNSARNTPAFEELCHRHSILPLCGLEVTTVEELHCLALFETAEEALRFGTQIEAGLSTRLPNDPARFGSQVVVDAQENVVDEVEVYLGVSTRFSLQELGQLILLWGGLFIPAHADRERDSILSQLGYLPDLPYSALELRGSPPPRFDIGTHTVVRGSDAHYPENIGERTCWLEMEELNLDNLQKALRERGVF